MVLDGRCCCRMGPRGIPNGVSIQWSYVWGGVGGKTDASRGWQRVCAGALAAGMRHKVAHGQRLRTPAARSSIWSSIWSTRRSIWSGRGSTWSARRSMWGAGTSILSARRSMWSARGSLDGPLACSCTICMHLACISVYLNVLDRPRRGPGGLFSSGRC